MANYDGHHDRRKVLRVLLIGGVATTLALPSKWMKPIINSVIVPAHAATSAPPTTTTTTTTTSTTPDPPT
jgi:hypothetical protein